jgi:hypothetical protein
MATAFSIDRNCDKNLLRAQGVMSTESTIGNGETRLKARCLREAALGKSAELQPLTSIANVRFVQEAE